jgi:hypothetical protein
MAIKNKITDSDNTEILENTDNTIDSDTANTSDTNSKNIVPPETDAPKITQTFVYAGPTSPNGELKTNAVFNGTFEDIKKYYSDLTEQYPQILKLIVSADKFSEISAKTKTPGNITNKYYNDLLDKFSKGKKRGAI